MAAAEARRQAEAEGVTLLRSEINVTGFVGVSCNRSGAKPYEATMKRGGRTVSLGRFATAEEAALAVARSPEGKASAAAAAARAVASAPLTAAEARRQAKEEGLTLLRSESNASGFYCVSFERGSKAKPYVAQVSRAGEQSRGGQVYLGSFATAEEAALAVARTPEGKASAAAAAARAAAPAALTAAEAWRQAEEEGLTLLRSESHATGFLCVHNNSGSKIKPYVAQTKRGGKTVHFGCFATAEEAALAFARSSEGRAAAAAPPSEPLTAAEACRQAEAAAAEARRQAEAEGLTLLRSESSASGFFGVGVHGDMKQKPYVAQVRRGRVHVYLGSFGTAEEAALAVARSPKGNASAARGAAPAPLTAAEALRQAEAEGLTLLRSERNASGFNGVNINGSKTKPCEARAWRGGKTVYVGSFATAEEAALAVAREGSAAAAAAAAAAAPAPPTAVEAWRHAEAEGLTLPRYEGAASSSAAQASAGVHAAAPAAAEAPARGTKRGREQGDGLQEDLEPVARALALSLLPPSPSPPQERAAMRQARAIVLEQQASARAAEAARAARAADAAKAAAAAARIEAVMSAAAAVMAAAAWEAAAE